MNAQAVESYKKRNTMAIKMKNMIKQMQRLHGFYSLKIISRILETLFNTFFTVERKRTKTRWKSYGNERAKGIWLEPSLFSLLKTLSTSWRRKSVNDKTGLAWIMLIRSYSNRIWIIFRVLVCCVQFVDSMQTHTHSQHLRFHLPFFPFVVIFSLSFHLILFLFVPCSLHSTHKLHSNCISYISISFSVYSIFKIYCNRITLICPKTMKKRKRRRTAIAAYLVNVLCKPHNKF